MTLLPYESFSPDLLRSDPAALASWIRHRFVRWLLGVTMTKTRWAYVTKEPLLVPVGVAGGDEQKLSLPDDRGDTINLRYHFPGPALRLGAPLLQTDNRGFPEEKTGRTIWVPGDREGDGHSGALRNLHGMKRAVIIDLHMLFGRRAGGGTSNGALMLLGVDPPCGAWIRRMGFYTAQLLDLAVNRGGFHVPFDTRSVGGLSFEDIRYDVDKHFHGSGFNAAIFFDGLKGASGHTVYLGEIVNAVEEHHPGPGATLLSAAESTLKKTGSALLKTVVADVAKGDFAALKPAALLKTVPGDALTAAKGSGEGMIGKELSSLGAGLGASVGLSSKTTSAVLSAAPGLIAGGLKNLPSNAVLAAVQAAIPAPTGGAMMTQMVGEALGNATGGAVTSFATAGLGMTALGAIVSSGVTLALSKSGALAAVTGTSPDKSGQPAVQVDKSDPSQPDGVQSSSLSEADFTEAYDTLVHAGVV